MSSPVNRADLRELAAALTLIATGGISLWLAQDYALGSIIRMGPGFVPRALSILLIVLGLMLSWSALRPTGDGDVDDLSVNWRPAILVLGALLGWALLVRRIGFVPSTFFLVILCSLAEGQVRLVPTLIWAAGICLFGYVVFLWALHIPLPAFGAY